MYLLGIDLGTTGCKSMIFDEKGTILGSSYIEYDLIYTDEGIEQDAHAWWGNVKKTIKQSLQDSGVDGKNISALSVSSQGIAFVPVDKDGNTLYNAISWLDGRSKEEVARINKECDPKEIFYHTGKRILPHYVLPQLMWLKANRTEVYNKTYKVLMAHDYIIYNLTGKMITDLSMASGTLSYDIRKKSWMTDLLDKFDIDETKLPDLMVIGQVAGTVLPEVADELGLSDQTKVVVGAQDQRCASMGAGIDKGIFTVSLGTASSISAITDKPLTDDNMQVTCCGLDERYWILETVVSTAGVALKWLRNTLFPQLSYAEMDSLAQSAEPLSGGVSFYPHLTVGASGKANGTFKGLSLQTNSQDIIRAVLEGVAYQIKIHISNMEKMGITGNEIRLFGGGANSSVWCQIIADITNKRVVIPRTNETANLGAAMVARMGLEGSTDFHSSYSMLGEPAKVFTPEESRVKIYQDAYQEYVKIHTELISK